MTVGTRGPSITRGDVDLVVRLLHDGPLTRGQLLDAMRIERPTIGDSTVRVAIEDARATGHLIVHLDGAYRIAATEAELEAWITREPEPRMLRLSEEIRAMRRTAREIFPPSQQRWIA